MYTAKVTKQISRWPNSSLIKVFMLDLNFSPNSMQNIHATQKSLPPNPIWLSYLKTNMILRTQLVSQFINLQRC